MKIRLADIALTCLLLPAVGVAQDAKLQMPDFSSLAGKATDSVNVTLSPWLLRIAAAFVDDKDEDSAATKKLLAGIKSVEVRSYEFDSDFAYSTADIEAVKAQLAAPGWSPLVQTHDRKNNEDVDVYIFVENNRTRGLAVISREPREFTIVNIVGSIAVEDLPKLGQRLHLLKNGTPRPGFLM
jgi:hypothetical protein